MIKYGEKDFTTDDPSKIGTGAVKYDGGKPAIWRGVINYFPRALWAVGEISTFGAKKYAWNGWEDVADGFARYKDAQLRHMLLAAQGEKLDPDSEYEHLAHEAWGALAALELHIRDQQPKQEKEPEPTYTTGPSLGEIYANGSLNSLG